MQVPECEGSASGESALVILSVSFNYQLTVVVGIH